MQENGFGFASIDTRLVPTCICPEPAHNNAMTLLGIREAEMNPATQSGSVSIQATPSRSKRVKVGIVTNQAFHTLSSRYQTGVHSL